MITDDEFRCRLELRLNDALNLSEAELELIWKIVADIRGVEREMISRAQMHIRHDIHPVCYIEANTNTLPKNTTIW